MAAQQIDNNLAQDEAQEEEEVEEEVGFVGVDALTSTYRSSCELRAASCELLQCVPTIRVAPSSLLLTLERFLRHMLVHRLRGGSRRRQEA